MRVIENVVVIEAGRHAPFREVADRSCVSHKKYAIRRWQRFQATNESDRISESRVVARVEASEAQMPASVDEVRTQVEKDLRIEAAMKSLEPTVRELSASARKIGLKSAVALFDDLKKKQPELAAIEPPPFARSVSVMSQELRKLLTEGKPTLVAPNVSGLGTSQAFVDACIEMLADGWKAEAAPAAGDKLKLATTRPALTPEPAVRVVALPGMGKWCVVERVGAERVDTDKYATSLHQSGYGRLMGERGAALLTNWFSAPNIEKRTQYERIVRAPAGPTAGDHVTTERETHKMLDF